MTPTAPSSKTRSLRRARVESRIGFYRFKNTIHYREDDLLAYLHDRLTGGLHAMSAGQRHLFELGRYWISDVPGSPNLYASGMTPELERSAAALLRHQISKPPRSRSRPSSSRKEAESRSSPDDVAFLRVFERYWTQHSDKTRSKSNARLAGKRLLDSGTTRRSGVSDAQSRRSSFECFGTKVALSGPSATT